MVLSKIFKCGLFWFNMDLSNYYFRKADGNPGTTVIQTAPRNKVGIPQVWYNAASVEGGLMSRETHEGLLRGVAEDPEVQRLLAENRAVGRQATPEAA